MNYQKTWGTVSEAAIAMAVEKEETMVIYNSFELPLPKGRGRREEMLRNNGTSCSSQR